MSEKQEKYVPMDIDKFEARAPGVPAPIPANIGPMDIMMEAVQRGQGKEILEQLQGMFEFQKKIDAEEAKKAYYEAVSNFKASPPKVKRSKHVRYQKKDKSWTDYWHADLGEASEIIDQGLSPWGLSKSWETNHLEGGILNVTCTISHKLGYSKSTSLPSPPDQSGGKNSIQAMGSALYYLQRYTLFSILGIAPKGMDDDGKTSEQKKEPEFITEDQVKEITKRLKPIYGDDASMFMTWLKSATGSETIDTIPAKKHNEVTRAIKGTEDAVKKAADRDESRLGE